MSQTKIKRGPSSATKSYLLAYNGGSAALWGYVLIRALRSLAQTGDITQTFPNASKDLVWIQPLAVLEATEHWALSTMTIAWSITEVIRYLFYAFNLVGTAPSFIIWFGASSEMFVAYQALPHLKTANPAFYYTLVAILFYYPLGFYQLFTYMIKQRAKTLGGKSKKVE